VVPGAGRFARAPLSRKLLVLEAFAGLVLIALLLRARGLMRSLAWIDDTRPGAPLPAWLRHDDAHPQTIARIVAAVAGRCPWQPRCLPSALTTLWMLRRRRLPGTLVVGARPTPAGVDAHAWVEYRGVPLAQRPDVASQFPPLLPPASSPAAVATPGAVVASGAQRASVAANCRTSSCRRP
jgi:hypothetical protein